MNKILKRKELKIIKIPVRVYENSRNHQMSIVLPGKNKHIRKFFKENKNRKELKISLWSKL